MFKIFLPTKQEEKEEFYQELLNGELPLDDGNTLPIKMVEGELGLLNGVSFINE